MTFNYYDPVNDLYFCVENQFEYDFSDWFSKDIVASEGIKVKENSKPGETVEFEVEVNSSTKNSIKTWTYETNKQYFRLVNDINFNSATIASAGYSSFELDGTKYNVFTQNEEGKYKLNNVSKETFT